MKADRFAHQPLAGPRTVALIFDKPTLRTQLSFSVGVAELGGQPVVIDGRLAGIGVRRVDRRHRAGAVAAGRRDRVAHLRSGPHRGDGGTQPGAGRQRAHRRVPPVPDPRRPADGARAQEAARRADFRLPRRRREQHGALVPARRRDRGPARSGRPAPAATSPTPASWPTPSASPRSPVGRSASPTTRTPRSRAPTSSPPTPGSRWARRRRRPNAKRRSNRLRSPKRRCSRRPMTRSSCTACPPTAAWRSPPR